MNKITEMVYGYTAVTPEVRSALAPYQEMGNGWYGEMFINVDSVDVDEISNPEAKQLIQTAIDMCLDSLHIFIEQG